MSWRDFIPQDRLDEFDGDTLPVVKDKLQAGLYSGRHKDHAEGYVAGARVISKHTWPGKKNA